MDNKQQMKKTSSSMPTTYHHHHHPPPPPYHPTAYNGYPYNMPPYNMQHHHHHQLMMMPPIQHHRTPMPPIQHQQQAPTTATTNPFNVTVIPAKKLTRKRKYCKQEGCKLKQKKGEYCFKHSFKVVHDGAAPDLTKLVPPTPQEVQQQLTTHRERSVAVGDSCKRVPPPANTNDQVAFTLYREAKKQTKPIQPVPRSRSESISSLQHKQSREQEMEMLQLVHKQQLDTLRLQHLLQQDDVVEAATTVRSATYDYDQRTNSVMKECIRDHPSPSSNANKHSLQQLETELRLLRQFQQYQIPVYKNANRMGEQQRSIPPASRDRRDETVRPRADYDQCIEECRDPSPVDPPPVVDLTVEEDTPQVSACHATKKRKISQSSSDPSTAARPNKMSTSQVPCHDTRKRKIPQSSSSDPSTAARPNKMSLLLQALEEKLE